MLDKLDLKLQGEITVLRDGEIILQEQNEISPDWWEIILRCLAPVPIAMSVDTITFRGDDFGPINKPIINTEINVSELWVKFIAIAMEEDFNGTVTDFNLGILSIDKSLAFKTEQAILKTDSSRLEVRWKIKINA